MAFHHWVRLGAVVSSCVVLGLVTHVGGLGGGLGAWCMFCWAFSLAGTLLISLLQIFNVNMNICNMEGFNHEFWDNVSATFFSYAALLCLSTSIIFPSNFLKGHQNYDVHNHRAAAEFFSCVTTLMYVAEVQIARAQPTCYMATTRGILKVCQTFVAGFILFFISNPVLYADQAAVQWCMAVYCICFIWSMARILRRLFCNQRDLTCVKSVYVCVSLMYLSAAITWPVFKLNSHYPSPINPPGPCPEVMGLCPWGQEVVVTVLTALNFLLYFFCTCCLYISNDDDQQYRLATLSHTISATLSIGYNTI
ncbi:myeloid-associated differentiation marker homolog isoform X1 [Brachyhypopomus gauderio]|uniref:myeloid-associated differentiation marker homolog isoform X1 n=1 Tax=Brachyhypopomus gauderio TaxID=698409 RepID=UPI004042DEFA